MKTAIFLWCVFVISTQVHAQVPLNYEVNLTPVTIPNLPGLHAYAFAQHNGKWLIIGGRKDGLHARQPFNAFPQSNNNTDIYVIDVATNQFWSSTNSSLSVGLQEQLQATNMNFYQDKDTLYIIGGYAFSATANDHITFPNLTSVQVSSVIDAVINGTSISPFFKQTTDSIFAVTGGQLGKIGSTFYLVGGQRFDGRYNPMGHNTYVQTYTNQIQKFNLDNSGVQLSFSNYSSITDPIHLRRRDYNLLPQIFPDGTEGYTISSGVFQINADLPFLYPVDITQNGYAPITTFNQYLSNYHSAKACLFDSVSNQMHSLFFGGLSQYYYQNGSLVQDNQVPFVKTISLLTRYADSSLQEYQLPIEMPALKGASAEFIPNHQLPHYESEIIKLSAISADSILIGHIYGGIHSPTLNPFSNNATSTTNADSSIFEVWLIKKAPTGVAKINGKHSYTFEVSPNPVKQTINIQYSLKEPVSVAYFLTTIDGKILAKGVFDNHALGEHSEQLVVTEFQEQVLILTLVFDNKFYVTKKIMKLSN